ncbi:MAG: DUF6265 family protein [Hyphomonadaceae bacterium]
MRVLVLIAALAFAPQAEARTLDDLSWLVGCWQTEAPREAESGAIITEVWTAPPMPALLGFSYTLGEGEIQAWEQTRIDMVESWPVFVAMPNGGPPVRFRLRDEDTPNAARFDNPAHDYPQTVEYRREGDRLIATISGANGADPFTFDYHRIACDAMVRP